MIPMTVAEIAEVVGGTLNDPADPTDLVTSRAFVDSRDVEPGGLFACVVGERVDGHDFAGDAVALGAVLVLASRPVAAPAVLVPDVVVALGRLASHLLSRLPELRVVGITGSSGKTSTKDLLAQVATLVGPTVAPVGSFNTEIGLPLTVLRAGLDTRVLVLEMGARGVGHVAELCAIAAPDIGVVLNVGTAHVGAFGSVEAIATAKGELVEALSATGVAVLNADDPLVAAMADRTVATVVRYGRASDVDVRADDVVLAVGGHPEFVLVTPEGSAPVRLQLVGEHHVANALACAAAARGLGCQVGEVAAALTAAVPLSRWRMEVVDRTDGVTVVNDAYNANPESVRAALDALVAIAGGRRTWAVLGEMRELGDNHDAEHEAAGRSAARLGVDRLVVVGEAARPMLRGASLEGSPGEESVLVPDVDAAIDRLMREVLPGDVVLVKASRAAGLERVAAALLEPTGGDQA